MKNANEPAYPVNEQIDCLPNGGYFFHVYEGLTKREKFAMAAMQGILSNPALVEVVDTAWVSKESINQADALLKQLRETA